MTVETFSFSELTLAKLFNGHAVNDDLNIFDNMMSGFNLSVVIATAFVTRVEVYANERTETIMHGESETTYEGPFSPFSQFSMSTKFFGRGAK